MRYSTYQVRLTITRWVWYFMASFEVFQFQNHLERESYPEHNSGRCPWIEYCTLSWAKLDLCFLVIRHQCPVLLSVTITVAYYYFFKSNMKQRISWISESIYLYLESISQHSNLHCFRESFTHRSCNMSSYWLSIESWIEKTKTPIHT